MTRYTLICDLERVVLASVPPKHRRAVRALQAAIQQIWMAATQEGEEQSYAAGVKAEQDRVQAAEKRGFDLGYQHGLDRAIGAIGVPAGRLDEDDLTTSVS